MMRIATNGCLRTDEERSASADGREKTCIVQHDDLQNLVVPPPVDHVSAVCRAEG